MLRINYRKRIYEYKEKEMPKFKNRKQKNFWLQREKRKAMLYNIKNVEVQIKDIKKFCFSDNPALPSLYAQYIPFQLDDEEYITVSRFKNGNDLIVYALITSDWILDESKLEAKSTEEIEEEIIRIRECINKIMQKSENKNEFYLKNQIILLQYKQKELTKYLNKNQEQSFVLQKKIGSKKSD